MALLILARGNILPLGRHRLRPVSHLAIRDGLVIAAGGSELEALREPGAELLDLAGATVLPGFHDPHAHVVYHGLMSFGIDLTGVTGGARLLDRIRRLARGRPRDEWIQGRGLVLTEFGASLPDAAALDAALEGRPGFFDDRSGHVRLASAAALAAAGIGPDTPDPEGGWLGRDPTGRPNGLLGESAMRLVADRQPPPSLARRKLGILRCQRLLLARGITSVGAAVNRGFADDLAAFQELRDEGRLKVRVTQFLSWELLPALRRLGLHTGFGDDRLRLGPVKVFIDGGASVGAAALRAAPDPRVWRTPPEALAEIVGEASRGGLQVAAHAVGDGAIAAYADAVEAAALEPGRIRHRVEHCLYCPLDLARRLAALRMHAVVQPHAAGRRRQLAAGMGLDSHAGLAAFGGLIRAGVHVAFSSDLPVVADPDPWIGVKAVLGDGDQRLTLRQALVAYTHGGAEVNGTADRLGTLEPGRLADFQVYADDPLRQLLAGGEPEPPGQVYIGGRRVR